MIDSAIRALKPGGVLAYVTCSPHLAETRAVVETATKKHGDSVQRLDTASVLAGVTREPLETGPGPHVQLWPHAHGTDAMFIQLIGRVAS